MGRLKTLNSAKSNHVEDEKQQMKPSNSPIVLSSDDDEANEDLSLKIVERAKLRSCTTSRNAAVLYDTKRSGGGGSVDVIDVSLSPSLESEVVTDVKDNKKKKKEKKKKKNKMIETQDDTVDVAKEAEKEGICKSIEVDKSVERNPVEISDNTVLRKLLRGPRYFDPPDSGWGTCYNCGEEGHTTVNCTSARRKKPCFVCGSLDHNAKQCKKGQDCFICKKRGHRAKDCPEKYTQSQSAKICLKCGHSGHEMFTCKNDYSPEDLKEIQCYMCKSFGHLSCVNYTGTVPRDVSCYKCGQSGHTGLACMGLRGETNDTGSLSSCYRCGEEGHFARECTSSTKAYTGLRGETNDTGSPSSCYRCGEGGHFARECTSSVKAYTGLRGETNDTGSPSSCYRCGEGGHFARECTSSVKSAKRNREVSTPTRRYTKENRDWLEARSAPHDFGKARKRKKNQYDEGSATSSKSKHRGGWITEDPEDLPGRKAKANGWGSTATPKQRGGWITEDPGDLPRRKGKANGWGSPSTPTYKNNKIYDSSYGGHASNSRSRIGQNRQYENTFSNGSANFYQQRYSASRFNNYSSDGTRRNYDW